MKFVHVATRTKDLDAAIAFYGLLGMKLTRASSELTKNQATLAFVEPPEGNFAIELVYNWGHDDALRRRRALRALRLRGRRRRRDLRAAHGGRRHRRCGAPALLQGVGPSKIAFVADPDGNQIELIERDAA